MRITKMSVYPRWRGEHLFPLTETINSRGLSPLARGTRLPVISSCKACRFIPAGAGNTTAGDFGSPWVAVYPRWRGEHDIYGDSGVRPVGLSPLARGTLLARYISSKVRRFIPAGAGNTKSPLFTEPGLSVYPRWRGEHPRPHLGDAPANGLSPLARGTHLT